MQDRGSMVARSNNLLGSGLYSVREAAFYARIPPQTLGRWLFGNKSGQAVLDRQLRSEERLVTFLDFVQALAVRSVRIMHRVPLPEIRKAVRNAEQKYGVRYPFARRHTTYLIGDEIAIRLGDDRYVAASGKHAGNLLIKQVVETYMVDLSFDASGLAQSYRAFEWNERVVTMDPRIRFGEPVIPTCGYTAQALWDAVKAEGGIEPAARAYGVEVEDIQLACKYFDHLLPKLAV
jgi:uncharacterized protein (DUF433 family)